MSKINQIKFKFFLNKVRITRDYDQIIDYVRKHKQLHTQQLYYLTNLICESKEPGYLTEFIKTGITDVCCLNKIGHTLSLCDSSYFINYFITNYPELRVNSKLIDRLCELKGVEYLYGYLKNIDNDFVLNIKKRKIISILIEDSSIKQLVGIIPYKNILTVEERRLIINKVCSSLNAYYICMFAISFGRNNKMPFVNAISKTKNAEMMYCFISQVSDLEYIHIEKIIKSIAKTNDIEYIYKSLLLLENKYSDLRKLLLEKIKESDNPKYMLFAMVYSNKEYLVKHYDLIQNLYDKATMSEDIFSDKELMDMYKHMQEVKVLVKKNNN